MKKIYDLPLYDDLMGRIVTSPVLQIGRGAPHVVMVALQHGWEIIGLDTALQVMEGAEATGTITLISVASPKAYQDGHRLTGHYLSPSSKQPVNMNRIHPGVADGNVAERSAWAIDQYLQSIKPDYIIDLHSYASQSIPHAIVDECYAQTQGIIDDWAARSGTVWYREYSGQDLKDQVLDKALAAVWARRGIPSLTLELGPINLFSPAESTAAQIALSNTLKACGALSGEVVDQVADVYKGSIWQRSEVVYRGDKAGFLRPKLPISQPIRSGDILGEIVTPDGKVVDTIKAPDDGIHFIWHNEFRVLPGSLVAVQLIASE